ncbi:DUF3306 domain-containing protein [Oceanibaculum pacificum]|uniref:DUF3306 domain-containing protein n=1 Tax=Oceanibaculum pacificum TaxID=580166 RepID=A0A154VRQ8_9PROT|nr:DUF3306 domain-containing protein [Oceanibaculum pacificum]KZD03908.1 hypothetical protein AUP43_12460 [Oceanibaculum pacificum]
MADGFLGRWSRLKQQTRHTDRQAGQRRAGAAPVLPEEQPAIPSELPPEEQALAVPAQPDAAAMEGEKGEAEPKALPDIESLTAESDFSAFMQRGVPSGLRRRALRKLWASDPIYAFQDGLTDYAEDYTDAATVVEGMKTSWKLGQGFLSDAEVAENDSVYRASRKLLDAAERAAEPDAVAEAEPAQEALPEALTDAGSETDAEGEAADLDPGETPPETVAKKISNENDNHS